MAQKGNTASIESHGRNHEVSLILKIPFSGYLKDISNVGIGAAYSWSKERFGKMTTTLSRRVG